MFIHKILFSLVNSIRIFYNEMEFDVWRFRLPPSTLPELGTASFIDGELLVVVPKVWSDGNDNGQFVLVH
ncbi:hypothetical protein R6Q57_001458 [Mikania cordata]